MAYLNSRPRPPEVCPICGEDVPAKAMACPECGADHNSGWKPDAYNGGDIPDEDFDYEGFIRDEFGKPKPAISPLWWITAVLVLAALIAGYLISAL